MALDKITYSPSDVLTSDQMNKIQDEVINNANNIETHLNDINPHGAPRLTHGSYTGTGKAGNLVYKNSLTFEFVPKIVFIFKESEAHFLDCDSATHHSNYVILINGMIGVRVKASDGGCDGSIFMNWNDTTLEWWHADPKPNAEIQLNSRDQTYYYVALG